MLRTDLSGRNAIVGGASDGLGFASANELADLGANVTLVSRNREKLKEALLKLDTSRGQEHDIIVADHSEGAAAAKAIIAEYTHIPHILVLNSGGPPAGSALDMIPDNYQVGFDTHFTTSHELVMWAVPQMEKAAYGRIVNILSISVQQPIDSLPVSNMIRAGISSWAKTVSNAVAHKNITVNNVLPGYTMTNRMKYLFETRSKNDNVSMDQITREITEQIPARRFAEPHELGEVVAFLCSPAASYITGVNLAVDGGYIKGNH